MPLLTRYRNEHHTEDFLARFCASLAPEKPQLIALALALSECDDKNVQGEVGISNPTLHFLFISVSLLRMSFRCVTYYYRERLSLKLTRTVLFFVSG